MAIYREPECCDKCGKHLKGEYKNMGEDFVGDTFIRFIPCPCSDRVEEVAVDKPFFIDTFRALLNKYEQEEISISKVVEELNIDAIKWRQSTLEKAQTEIEKLKENWNEYDQLIKDYAYQSSEIERLEVELENVRLYFSLTESEFDNIKIKNKQQ